MRLLLALAVALPAFAQQCTYSVSPSAFNLPASTSSPNTGVAKVSAPDGCSWQATVSPTAASWLSVYTGQSGTGNGTVGFLLAQNDRTAARTGTISIATAIITVTQAAANCTYTLSPTSMNFPVGGGTGSVQVATNCVWSTGVSNTWIVVPPNTGGTFPGGTVNYTVNANPCLASRTGALGAGYPGTSAIALLSLTQDGSPNNLTISPTSLTVGAAASDGQLTVTIGSSCGWTAFSDASWLQITSAPQGSGPGFLSYHVAANPSSTRTGNIHVGPQTFTITQQAVAAPPMQVTAVTNAASGQQGAVSPGEIVAIYGTNMGPNVGVPLQVTSDGHSITTTLGGVQVLFDGTPAALTYASATQINAVVPYTLDGKFDTQLQVQYQGATSNTMSLSVQKAGPGIFTLDSSGTGPGAILNQDNSVNANANRAARGSVVQIYLTGGGATNPVSVDASITPNTLPLPLLVQPVSILIGGSVATVQYAGAAPGGIAGFTQINVTVPDGVIPGASVPVVIGIGAWVSQPGVTMAIK
ncbi:MAG TPA: BACON domain-containing carbohydrate-binding protein [Bryobacteraceae bacterium]|nr:BACON domain-containing carbohydrate-binding protein [Bryobacteraceae bacterium]